MRKPILILTAALLASAMRAEEVSDIPPEEVSRTLERTLLTTLVSNADCAGVGLFLNVPSPSAPSVDILVQQWWTPPLATNIIRIHELDSESTNWAFPTNVPVVFFAVTKRNMYDGEPAFVIPDEYPPEWVYSITNAAEMSKLMFPDGDRAWFRTTRDNGLVHTFATNLWECVRTNPNPTNYYHVLRDAERTVSRQDSWRVHLDAYKGLDWLFFDPSEEYLVEKLNDPLLSSVKKGYVRAILYDKFSWRYVDGVITPPQ